MPSDQILSCVLQSVVALHLDRSAEADAVLGVALDRAELIVTFAMAVALVRVKS